jgi:chromosomal replication initiation ATPase DnaA
MDKGRTRRNYKKILMTTLHEQQERLIELTCSYFHVDRKPVMGKLRVAKYVQARHVLMYLFRTKLKMTLSQIAEFFGRDHTTVIFAVRNIENCLEVGDYLAKDVERLKTLIERYEMADKNKVLVTLPDDVDLFAFVTDITANYRVSYSIV